MAHRFSSQSGTPLEDNPHGEFVDPSDYLDSQKSHDYRPNASYPHAVSDQECGEDCFQSDRSPPLDYGSYLPFLDMLDVIDHYIPYAQPRTDESSHLQMPENASCHTTLRSFNIHKTSVA